MMEWLKTIRPEQIIRAVWYAGILAAAYLLQALVFPYLPIWSTKPLLLPTAAVGVALFEGPYRGAAFGLVAGILCDSAMNHPTVGFTVFLMLIGLGVGYLCEDLLTRGFPTFALLSVTTLVLSGLLQCVGPVLNHGANIFHMLLVALVQTVYSLIGILPAYLVCRRVSRFTKI